MNTQSEIKEVAKSINALISKGHSVIPSNTQLYTDILSKVSVEAILNLGCKKVTRPTLTYFDLPEHEIEASRITSTYILYGNN